MPTYVYRNLVTNQTFELKQSMKDDALKVHPETGEPVKRLLSAPGIAFKGSGFYANDSRSSGRQAKSEGSRESGSESKSESQASTGSESKGTESKSSESKSADSNSAAAGSSAPTKTESGGKPSSNSAASKGGAGE